MGLLFSLRLQVYILLGAVITRFHPSEALNGLWRSVGVRASIRSCGPHPICPLNAFVLPMALEKSSTSSKNESPLSTLDAPKVGVLLLNLGGPETGNDVEGTVCVAFWS